MVLESLGIREEIKMRAVILANGEFPTNKDLLMELKEASFLAVCDGAVRHLEALGIEPSIVIGDLDSISKESKEKYAQKIVHIKEQESNDLSKAFFYCVGLGFDEFVILGATGKREDHTLGNISLLSVYINHCKSVVIKSDFGIFSIHKTPCKIQSFQGEQISIISLGHDVALSSEGLKYPLVDLKLPIWASGTLNESLGESFSITSKENSKVLIFRANPSNV